MNFPQYTSIPQQLRHLQIFSLSSLGPLRIISPFLLLLVETGKCSVMIHSATEMGYDDACISSSSVMIMEHWDEPTRILAWQPGMGCWELLSLSCNRYFAAMVRLASLLPYHYMHLSLNLLKNISRCLDILQLKLWNSLKCRLVRSLQLKALV